MSYSGLNDEIKTINGNNILNFNLETNKSIIIEPSTLIHMDGKLILEPTAFSKGGIFSGLKRGLSGQSIISSQITNKTSNKLNISLCPRLLGSINKIEIQPNQVWKFTPSSFIACTDNILVSGNIDIFSNFKSALGGQNIIYTEISTHDGKPGIVWISSYGALEKHEIQMGKNSEKLVINDGVFLGMLSEDKDKKMKYWDRFVNIGSANGFFKGLLTQTALLMNIEDQKHNAPDNTTCIVYTQSLNIRNLQNYIVSLSQPQLNNNNNNSLFNVKLLGGDENNNHYNKLIKYQNKIEQIKK